MFKRMQKARAMEADFERAKLAGAACLSPAANDFGRARARVWR
jgi:hypothetical protein